MAQSQKRLLKLFALMVSIVLIAAACGDDDDDAEGDDEDSGTVTRDTADGTLTVNTLLPFSGQLDAFGPSMRAAVELAVADINEAGGVLDNDVVLAENDDSGTDADIASSAMESSILPGDGDVLMGAAASGVTSDILAKTTGSGMLMCSPSNTAASLSEASDDGLYFRTAPSDDLQGPALADRVAQGGHASVAILARNDDYGKGFQGALEDAFGEIGLDITESISYDSNATDFSADVKKVADSSPESVVVIGFVEDGAKILGTMIENGLGPDAIDTFTADGMQSQDLAPSVDPNNPNVIDGLKGTAPSGKGTEEFDGKFTAANPDADTTFTSQSYDCMITTALAAIAAGSDDPDKIKEEMSGITEGGTECKTFADCKQLLEDGQDIDYDGASGPIEWDDEGDPQVASYDFWIMAEGVPSTEDTFVVETM